MRRWSQRKVPRRDQGFLAVTMVFMASANTSQSSQIEIGQLSAGEKNMSKYGHSSWHEKDGVIYFSVESDGTMIGEEWITRLETKGIKVDTDVRQVLRSPRFVPTNDLPTDVAVLKGILFLDEDRITGKIRAYAETFRIPNKRKLLRPNAELACLIRKKWTDKDLENMGFSCIVTMHEDTYDSRGNPRFIYGGRTGDGSWLSACYDWSNKSWPRDGGFAFAVSRSPK